MTFFRHAAIGPYVVDFACFTEKLIVELDELQHRESLAQMHNAQRNARLAVQAISDRSHSQSRAG